ncbi:MAG: serine/threonine-protein kinase [Rhodocyclaceae bacterium]|jgi:serine/threonine protein kinase|nr:protein kinase [Rhodocyclaceae bacterium]MBZ0133938.1 protein kinase [Rhodocyclaceae bacterium]MCO5097572.1 serine/threonine-protein kinase [Rhodocyclaceae bacterium]MCP5297986.1 protein kinase [Zoogloeaceae bacterium]
MDKIGKYQIFKKLGEGATSVVYLANDPFAERDVAIKVMAGNVFSEGERGKLARKLFVTEASLAGKLNHPHIVQIYDAAADADPSYIVMEYVAGGTLEPYCTPDKLLPLVDVVEMVFKCSRALDFAYRLGVIHRDLKPANILRGGDSGTDVKISDFGAAITTSSDQTAIAGIGSPAYMSPQQVQDWPLDHRTDIFSLGVVMYQLLTGQLPFQGSNNGSIVHQILNIKPPPPSAMRAGIPAVVDGVVMKALEKSLEDRYASWDDFSFDLAEAFRNEHLAQTRTEIADSEKFNTLRGLSFFRNFNDVQLWEVLRLSDWQRAKPGTVLMREGATGDNFCILAGGEVKVTKNAKLLNILSAGECFGEMAYLGEEAGTRGADVSTLSEATVITVPTDALRRASDACRHSFDRAFLRILVERLSLANTRLTSV